MYHPFPSADDRPLWDLHLSSFAFPSITAADELGLFDDIAAAPSTAEAIATRLGLNKRAVRALLPVLASSGLLIKRLGRYDVSETARNFLLRASPFYWGPVFALIRRMPTSHESLLTALRAADASTRWDQKVDNRPSNAWSEGRIAPELAQAIAAYMQANCLFAARVAAQRIDLSGSSRLLDVGAGSGAFSIEFARANLSLRCTMMDLREMCEVALGYVQSAGVAARVDACAVDMFRDDWPHGHDAVLFSNIFHDWDFETCAQLAAKAYRSLPSGGRVLLHEMLLDDTHDGPPTAAAFSLYMLLGTKGQQFTAEELGKLLTDAGFTRLQVVPTHGYFAVVSAQKP